MTCCDRYLSLAGRILLALIFIWAGLGKIGSYEATQGYMQLMGVPGFLLTPTIIFEAGAGVLIVLGLFTRITALLLAGFNLLTAVIFHHDFADQMQFIAFMKNVAIAGGFLLLARHGAGEISLDHRCASKKK